MAPSVAVARVADLGQRRRSYSLGANPPHFVRPIVADWLKKPTATLQAGGANMSPPLSPSWVIRHKELTIGRQIGKGSFAVVYRGVWRNQEVAIKRVTRPTGHGNPWWEERELRIMMAVRSPSVVYFHGVTFFPQGDAGLVMEYCHCGSLYDRLMRTHIVWKMGWLDFFHLAIQAAKAVLVLHSWQPGIAHSDLKTHNLLIDENNQVKICDFGVSTIFNMASDSSSDENELFASDFLHVNQNIGTERASFCGTLLYMAPERFIGEAPNPSMDVYAFGIVLWELLHRLFEREYQPPYAEYRHVYPLKAQLMCQIHQNQLRPSVPDTCPGEVRTLVHCCWSTNVSKRPTMREVYVALRQMRTRYNSDEETRNAWTVKRATGGGGRFSKISQRNKTRSGSMSRIFKRQSSVNK
jgi:serine/threonine protein kinase